MGRKLTGGSHTANGSRVRDSS